MHNATQRKLASAPPQAARNETEPVFNFFSRQMEPVRTAVTCLANHSGHDMSNCGCSAFLLRFRAFALKFLSVLRCVTNYT